MAVTDDFNRANGALGANWTTDSSFTALTIVSNACKGGTAGVHNVAVYTAGGTISADQYAQFKITTPGSYTSPVLRSNGAGTFYVCYYQPIATNVTIYKWIGGSATQIGSGSVVTPTANDVVYFEAVGNVLTFKVNGVVKATVTDSAITGAGYTGISIFDTGTVVDDFEGGAIGAVTVTVNLTGVSASPAVGVLGFNGSLPLVGVAAEPTIGIGTVAIEGAVTEPPPVSPGGGTGAGRPARTGMRLRPTEDKAVYLKGVAADPRVGQVMVLHEMQRVYEKYTTPIPKVQKPAEMPPGMRRLFKPVEKPIPPAVFVYQVGLPKLKAAVGNGKVKTFYEDIDEETIAMIDLL